MTKLKSLFSREPVRLASVAALLSVPAAEVARSQVSPTSKV